jgi:argininosuccinate lyase
MSHAEKPGAMWGGRFDKQADPLFRAFNDSLPFDWRLVQEDITGSIAWAAALGRATILTAKEVDDLVTALRDLSKDAAKIPAPPTHSGAEDVHSWVESRLIERLGDLGKKLHTGRSRNDQVATDIRLWTRGAITARLAELRGAQASLLRLAEREQQTPFPGYTHLQPAQPVLLAHWCLAHFEMLDRDADRFGNALRRTNICPLGSGALAGTAWPIDRDALARDLGFAAPTANSLDAVADRDFVLDTLSAAAICAGHLSRLAEELIIYTTAEFALVTLDDGVTSGSSLMPQKKNPDALELIRGKAGRITGSLVSLLMTVKGLPLAYNKDMQEDKEPLFDSMDSLSLCLRMVPRVLDGAVVDRDRCRRAAAAGYSNATELADDLVSRGVPFRDAHAQAGRAVREAIARNIPLEALPPAVLRSVAPAAGPETTEKLTIESALSRRDARGGTSPRRVAEAIADAHRRLEAAKKAAADQRG